MVDDEDDQIQEFQGLPHGGSSLLKSVASPEKQFDDQPSPSPNRQLEENTFSLSHRYKHMKQSKPDLPKLDMNLCNTGSPFNLFNSSVEKKEKLDSENSAKINKSLSILNDMNTLRLDLKAENGL